MIPPGVPPDRDAWPPELLEHLRLFSQGDLIEGFPAVYIGDPSHAVHAQTAAYADDGTGSIEFSEEFAYGIIVTQTCDLREEDSPKPSRPWVLIAPVYDAKSKYREAGDGPERSMLDGGIRRLLKEGRGYQYFIHLRDFGSDDEFWVADLRLVVAVDKGFLMERNPIRAFSTESDALDVGRRVAMLHIRPAFDGRFVVAVQRPLMKALKELAPTDRPFYEQIQHDVSRIGVRATDLVDMTSAEVWVIGLEDLSLEVRSWFEAQEVNWTASSSSQGLNLLPIQFADLNSMSASEYLSLTVVPLTYVSPDPPWYGAEPEA